MSLFNEDLANIARAHVLTATLPHEIAPSTKVLHHIVGAMGDVVRKAQSAHESGDVLGAADILDSMIDAPSGSLKAIDAGRVVPVKGYPAEGAEWSYGKNDDLMTLRSTAHLLETSVHRELDTEALAPEHQQAHLSTLAKVKEHLYGLASGAYRSYNNLRPADWDSNLAAAMGDDEHADIVIKEKKPRQQIIGPM